MPGASAGSSQAQLGNSLGQPKPQGPRLLYQTLDVEAPDDAINLHHTIFVSTDFVSMIGVVRFLVLEGFRRAAVGLVM